MKKINKLLLISSTLLTSLSCLAGCNKEETKTEEQSQTTQEPEVIKYDLMFLLDEAYEVIDAEGFNLDANGYASIEKDTQIKFKIKVNESVKLGKEGLIVKVNGNEIGDIDGVYKTTVNKDLEITVSGFVSEVTRHRISVKSPYGVEVVSEGKEAYPDKSYLIEEDTFSFKLNYLSGFKPNNLIVKANGEEITPINDVYTLSIKKDVEIEIDGISYEQLQIAMEETKLFSFTEIKGATLKDGVAYVNNETVSFKISPSVLADKDLSQIVVKNGEQVISPVNGTYSFKPTVNSIVKVEGLVQISETSQTTGNTFKKEVLVDSAFTPIATNVISGEVNDLADITNGYKKATYFAGEYSTNQLSLNSNESLEKFKSIEFEVNPFTADYIEFYSLIQSKPLFYINKKGWTKIKLEKGNDDKFHYFVNGEDKGAAAEKDYMLSNLQFRIQGSYLVSELVTLKDCEYVDPHHYEDIKALSGATYLEGLDEETEYGTKKWYEISGSSYGKAHNFSSVNPEMYSEIYFEIMPTGDYDGGPWFGFGSAGSTGGFVKDKSTFVIMSKNELGKWKLTLKNEKETVINDLTLGEDLSTSKIYLHPNKGSVTFRVTNFRFVDDKEYDPLGQKQVTIIENNLSHVTYNVEGQSGTSFKVDNGSTIKLTLYPENGYDGIVKVNGDVVVGDNNVYEILIKKTTEIEISEAVHHDVVKILDVICSGLNPTPITDSCFSGLDARITQVYQNAKSGGSLFPTSSVDITNYTYLYFYNYNKSNTQLQCYPGNSESGHANLGAKGEKVLVEFKKEEGVWNLYCNGNKIAPSSGKNTNNFGEILYLQFWGTNYISPLFGY